MALGRGGGGKGMSISSPKTNYQLVSSNGPPYASMAKMEANGGVVCINQLRNFGDIIDF